jgi:hypothetical protein
MELLFMLMDWLKQHYENGHTTKSDLHIQCSSYQNSKDIIHKNRKINPKIHMETLQPLWKAVWRFLKKLKIELPYDPVTPVLGIYPKEHKTGYNTDT